MNGKVKNAMAVLLLVAAPLATQAKQWSLKDCIDYALANNIALQKTQLTKASAQEDYLQSKAALLPSLSASTNQSVNYTPWVASGISGDGFSRASIDKVYYNGNYSLMGNYTIWNGNKNHNQVKLNQLSAEAAQLDSATQAIKLQEQIAQLYVQILYSTDMLCIHNDTYIEKPFAGKNINNKIARYFESNDGTKRMLVIYRAEAIQALVELMKQEFKNAESKENGKLMVYVFSPNGYAYDDEFEDVADYVSLCAMPDAVQNAYRRVLPKKRQAQLLDDIAEETDSEARTMEESDLFQNQTYTMAASEIKDNREGGNE